MEAMNVTVSSYPIRVDATLDPHLSRWLWLVKWVTVIPHYVILAFLWVAFVVLSVIAFFGILFSGRYPRQIFEFNVGVLRWSWRVAYFSYGALGTDRYPPFSLEERPDYPAHLDVPYPEHLSRGLVLVKWWLLAIPHYLVVGLFLGGGVYAANETTAGNGAPWLWASGLIGVLVLVAGVVLLFTGRYPRDLFDLILGMNRWVLRVAAYAGLMTDAYPPFRLDMGPDDPATGVTLEPEPPPPSAAPSPSGSNPFVGTGAPAPESSGGGWRVGRVVVVTIGSLLLLLSGGVITGGLALVVADHSRDDAGFVVFGDEEFSTSGYAISTENLDLVVDEGAEWVPASLLGETRLTAEGRSPIFLGIARTPAVEDYLAGVQHATVTEYAAPGGLNGSPVYRDHPGSDQPDQRPGSLDIWVAEVSGTGERSLTWTPREGDWTVVLMNSDALPGVRADVAVAAEMPGLDWAIPLVLSVGGTLFVVSVSLVAGGLLRARGRRTPTQSAYR